MRRKYFFYHFSEKYDIVDIEYCNNRSDLISQMQNSIQ